ncbi:hypothetical protein [Spirosoma gilvum]
MKTSILFMLLVAGLSMEVCGQATPARIPNKKQSTTIKNNTAGQTNSGGSTIGRSNQEKLPNKPAPIKPAPEPPHKPVYHTVPPKPPVNRPVSYGAYRRGDNLLNIGVGLSSYYYGNPIGASYEAGVDKDISVGVQLDYNAGNYGNYYYNNSRWRYTATYFGVRGSYHVNRLLKLNTDKVDLYAGLGLGYRSFRWRDSNYGYGYDYDYSSGLALNYYIGGKYYFSKQVGAFVELGYAGLSSSRVGLAIKF